MNVIISAAVRDEIIRDAQALLVAMTNFCVVVTVGDVDVATVAGKPDGADALESDELYERATSIAATITVANPYVKVFVICV